MNTNISLKNKNPTAVIGPSTAAGAGQGAPNGGMSPDAFLKAMGRGVELGISVDYRVYDAEGDVQTIVSVFKANPSV
ncbi:MAG: hypothetical protein ACP5IE_04305, partial [Infirmifilum sp.]